MRFFAYDFEGNGEFFDTEHEAKQAAITSLDYASSDAADPDSGWPENTSDICWGEIRGQCVVKREWEPEEGSGFGKMLEYELVDTPSEQLASTQAQIDRLTAQNLQLRLIADRAVVFLLAGSTPSQTDMNEGQLHDLNKYMDSVKYDDLEEADSTEDAFDKMLIKPLLSISNGTPDAVNLLELAMAEQNRRKLVDEEIGQLRELTNLKPRYDVRCIVATMALDFARAAGSQTLPREALIRMAPSVILAREAGVTIPPDKQ